MSFQELIQEIGAWRQQTSAVASEDELRRSEEEYQALLEREFLQQAMTLFQQYDLLEQTAQQMTAKAQVIRAQLEQLRDSSSVPVELTKGNTVHFDLSLRPAVQKFWHEVGQRFGQQQSATGDDAWLQSLKPIESVSFPNALQKEATHRLYDPAFLAQESDDLLNYL